MTFEPARRDAWENLRRLTAARIALGRTGGSLPTREVLRFGFDHALARDAVHAPLDAAALAAGLRPWCADVRILDSAAPDRATYLQRPDLGRRLSEAARHELSAVASAPCDLAIIVSDGLSAQAAQQHAVPLLTALLPRLAEAGFTFAPLCIVRQARVGLLNEVGVLLRARLALILLGERPGLGTPDSLGAYFEFDPQPSRTNADRNCVSNIRPAGLPPAAAAAKLASLLITARAQQRSGFALKDDPAPDISSPPTSATLA